MKLNELLRTKQIFSHIEYTFPLTSNEMDILLSFEFGERTVKSQIEMMINDELSESYLEIIGNTLVALFKDKWDRIKELMAKDLDSVSSEKTTTNYTGNTGNTTTNSVWGVSDSSDQNKDKTVSQGNDTNQTITEKSGKFDIDNLKSINNISLVSTVISDVANYLTLYVVD